MLKNQSCQILLITGALVGLQGCGDDVTGSGSGGTTSGGSGMGGNATGSGGETGASGGATGASGGATGSGGGAASGGATGSGGGAASGGATGSGGTGTGGTTSAPCDDVVCGANSSCNTLSGDCECDSGFQDEDGNDSCQADCSQLTCQNGGSCSIVGGEAECACSLGWSGAECDSCAIGFTGASCDTCDGGYFGSSCDACPACAQGSCDEGNAGSGLCACDVGFTGALCDTCETGYQDGSGSCDTCAPGFADTGTGSALCESCAPDFYGASCTACVTCENGGSCDEGIGGTGDCMCVGNFAGATCEVCSTGYTGAACDQCDAGYYDFDQNDACEADCGGGSCDGLDAAASLATGTHDFTLRSGTVPLYVDGDFDGGGWILVGRGREGWTWSDDGDGSFDFASVKEGLATSAAFAPRYLPTVLIQGLVDETPGMIDVSDVDIRLKRAADVNGTSYQEGQFRFTNRATWSWALNTDNDTYLVSGTVGASALGAGGSIGGRIRDTIVGGNNHTRIFTWAWGSHNNIKGFSYGQFTEGTNSNNPDTFLWEYANENHAIPYTEVYIRVPQPAP